MIECTNRFSQVAMSCHESKSSDRRNLGEVREGELDRVANECDFLEFGPGKQIEKRDGMVGGRGSWQ